MNGARVNESNELYPMSQDFKAEELLTAEAFP